MSWIYFGFVNCYKNDVEYNEKEIGYLLRFIDEKLKTSNKNRTLYKYIENIYNEFHEKYYEHNISLLHKIQYCLDNYSLNSSLNKQLSAKIFDTELLTSDGFEEWNKLYI